MYSILAKDHFQILGCGMAHTGHPAPVRCAHKTKTKTTYARQYTRISAGCELLPKGAAARNQLRPGASPRLLGCPSRPWMMDCSRLTADWTVPLETSSTPMMVLMKGAQQAKFLSSFWMCYPVA